MIEFACGQCGNRIRVSDEAAGKRGKCNKCGVVVKVPYPIATQRTVQAFVDEPPPVRYTPQPPPLMQAVSVEVNVPPPRPHTSSLGIASLILGILAFVICWIPLLGIIGWPLAILGVVLGGIGFLVAIVRRGRGIGFPIAGMAVCGLALVISFTMTDSLVKALGRSSRSSAVDAPKAFMAAPGRTEPVVPVARPRVATMAAVGDPVAPTAVDEWAKATTEGQLGDVFVRVERVAIGKVKLKDVTGDPWDSTEEQLTIALAVQNQSNTKKLNFRGWAGDVTDILDRAGTLADEHGNTYRRIGFGYTARPVGQASLDSIYPGKAVNDLLVFELPIEAARELRLTLPGAAVGGEGELKLKIPTASIAKPN